MPNGQPLLGLSPPPILRKVSLKIALGVVCVALFLDYQPFSAFPPVKKNIVAASEQVQSVTAQAFPLQFQLPHPGYLSTRYSHYHPGIDLASGLGIPIKAIAYGKVVNTGFNFWGLGLTVNIEHQFGYRSLYAHLGKIYVQKDQLITPSDYIGEVGLTGHTSGPHTHLEVYKDEVTIDPLTILPQIREFPIAQDFEPARGAVPVGPLRREASRLAGGPAGGRRTRSTPLPLFNPDLIGVNQLPFHRSNWASGSAVLFSLSVNQPFQ